MLNPYNFRSHLITIATHFKHTHKIHHFSAQYTLSNTPVLGWHGRLNAANHHNPNMWTFLEILKVEITLVRRELLDYRLGVEKRKQTYTKDMNKRLKNLCERPIPEADEEKVELLNSSAPLF